MYDIDKTKAASEELKNFWEDLTTENVYNPNTYMNWIMNLGWNNLDALKKTLADELENVRGEKNKNQSISKPR